MMIRPRVTKLDRSIQNLIRQMEDTARKQVFALDEAMAAVAGEMETYAKTNHKWTNQSRDAEAGLRGTSGRVGNVVAAEISHDPGLVSPSGFPYPVALETVTFKHRGFLGVINDTLDAHREFARDYAAKMTNGAVS